MQPIKETAANIAASALSGKEKTMAIVEEKMERVMAHTPTEKEMATERKEERVHHAELNKQVAREENAAAKMAARTGGSHPYTATGGHQLPEHGTGQAIEGAVKSHPVGTATSNPHVGGGANTGYGGTRGG